MPPSEYTPSSAPAPGSGWSRGIWLAGTALIGLTGWFYLWTAQSSANLYEFNAASRGYYNLLTDGYLDGHLWMKADPPVALLDAPNPYDPALAPLGLHDTSYYKGRYYLYFGSTPVLVLFLPVKVLMGVHCPENLAVAIFCLAALLINATLAALLLHRFFPSRHGAWWLVAILGLGLGNVGTVLLRRAAFWDVPISSAYLFGSASLLCVFLALTGRRTNLWLVLAGTSYGLAIGSRPVFAFGAAGLLAVWWAVCDRGAGWRILWNRRAISRALALFMPLGVLVAVILWHNHARFENPFEFGMTFALTGYDMLKWKQLDWGNVPLNAWYYFLSPAHWISYFPFVQASGPVAIAGSGHYYGQDNVFGIIPNLPIALFSLATPLLFLRAGPLRTALAAFTICLGCVFAANSLVLLTFSAAAGRYMVDMAPYAVLLGFCGVWAGLDSLAGRAWARRLWLVGTALAVAVTVAFNFFLGFQAGRVFELQNPSGYARAARFFNQGPAALERLQGYRPGHLELQVRFPRGKVSHYEPLVTTGWYFLGDILYVKYGADGLIEFGFTHMNSPTVAGPQVRIDYNLVHSLEIEMGSLYPPAAHPWTDGLLPQQVAQYKRRLRVRLNGQEVLAADTPFYESGRGDVHIGRNPLGFIVEKEFTGEIVQAARIPAELPAVAKTGQGPVRFIVTFPADKTGQAEPLVTTGRTGQGDVILVKYEAPDRIRFAHDHWGHGLAESEPIAVEPGRVHTVEVWMGSLLPEAERTTPPWGESPANADPKAPWCAVRLDGKIVWARQGPLYPARPEDAFFLQNPIGSTASGLSFTGEVKDWIRIPGGK